ncbi:MAG: hypothetical protein ACR2M4_07290 [Actinomycetota bacterium]
MPARIAAFDLFPADEAPGRADDAGKARIIVVTPWIMVALALINACTDDTLSARAELKYRHGGTKITAGDQGNHRRETKDHRGGTMSSRAPMSSARLQTTFPSKDRPPA